MLIRVQEMLLKKREGSSKKEKLSFNVGLFNHIYILHLVKEYEFIFKK